MEVPPCAPRSNSTARITDFRGFAELGNAKRGVRVGERPEDANPGFVPERGEGVGLSVPFESASGADPRRRVVVASLRQDCDHSSDRTRSLARNMSRAVAKTGSPNN